MTLTLTLLLVVLITMTLGQMSPLASCDSENEDIQCIINHNSMKFDQQTPMFRQLDNKINAINEQLPLLNQLDDKINDINDKIDDIHCQPADSESSPNNGEQFICPTNPDAAYTNSTLPLNCVDLYNRGYTTSGVYTIYEPLPHLPLSQFRSDLRKSMEVYCDMEEHYDGARGWLVFQRRQDGRVDFSRLWDGYRRGFGELSGEHWLGNDNLAIITGDSIVYELRVDLRNWEGERKYARYSSFKVETVDTNFQLRLGSYVPGDAGDSLATSNGRYFSTMDNDNDGWSRNCAQEQYMSGWWFSACAHAFLNNPYHNSSTTTGREGITWYHWLDYDYSLKFTEMKIRPV